jgi:DNA-binding NtrC family response regulator
MLERRRHGKKPTVHPRRLAGETELLTAPVDGVLESAAEHPLTPVLLLGKAPVPIARRLHDLTHAGRDAPFVHVDCVWLPGNGASSMLFGEGNGPGARVGLAQKADRGTLLLENVEELSSPDQARLAELIDEAAFRPVHGVRRIDVALRVVVTTTGDPHELVRASRLRLDLLRRVSVLVLRTP